ncbi:MAG: CPBP family intramembrane metalloprotease [Dehalococcoidales bacterium]|nr:CPBP family intramembrane metalloprotease [Dehalococcoidales bacterium]
MSGKSGRILKIISPIIPYITVGIGMFVLHNAWAAMMSYHLCMAVILVFEKQFSSLSKIVNKRNNVILIIMLVIGGVSGVFLYLLWPVLSIPEGINRELQDIGLNASSWPYFIAYFILVNPWLEELFWRDYLSSDTKRFAVNDFLFSGYHILVLAGKLHPVWLITVFLVIAAAGWFWRQVNTRNGSILASVVSHIAADCSVILAIYFLTSGM